MTEELFREQQRKALRDLIELTAFRGRTEAAVMQRHESDGAHNQETFDTVSADIRQRRETALSTARETFEREHTRIGEVIDSKIARARLEYEAEKERIEDKAHANLAEAEKQRQEAIWATETVFDAKKDQPDRQFQQLLGGFENAVVSIRSCGNEAAEFMRRIYVRPDRADASAPQPESVEPEEDHRDLETIQARIHEDVEKANALAKQIGDQTFAILLPGIRPFILMLILSLIGAGIGAVLTGGAADERMGWAAGGGAFFAFLIVLACYFLCRGRSRAMLRDIDACLVNVEGLVRIGEVKAARRRDLDRNEIQETRDNEIAKADALYQPIHDEVTKRRDHRLGQLVEAFESRTASLEDRRRTQLEALQHDFDARVDKTSSQCDAELEKVTATYVRQKEEIEDRYESDWGALESRWLNGMREVMETFEAIGNEDSRLFLPWDDDRWNTWEPPLEHAPAIRFGGLTVDRGALEGGLATDPRLKIDAPQRLTLPASLVFPRDCSLLFEFGDHGRDVAVHTLQNIMMRLLTTLPPGKVRFTIIDPVGLGESFAGFMHLADYDEQLVGARIWTETRHIEQRLADLTEHIENVIQKYLRNEFETIAQYNAKAGEIAEPYRFLVISDLPAGFNEVAARRLASIVSSGARCGLYTLIGLDVRQKMPPGIELSDLRQHCQQLVYENGTCVWNDDDYREFPLALDAPPRDAFITNTLQRVGKASKDTSRVEVPFNVITPRAEECWSVSTANEINVALGRAGATKLQYLNLGHGTSQHVLVAGKTGSGKSTLLHAMITNLAMWASPDEIEFYLVDFKKGVEFKAYATHRLPHARVIAIESDREFSLSVLQRVDSELKRRGKIFRELEVQDVAGFRKARPDQPMPRILLIIDEFQEFFVEDDKVSQDASLLLDRLVRQGRAFGIHVMLGSQTLGGAYSLARSTLGQMAVRIALQCSEADSYLILNDDNSAARLLARPGEAIYNDASGMVEGNNPFQTAWISDAIREDCLKRVAEIARARNFTPPDRLVVFEGNVPADIEQNNLLGALLDGDAWPSEVKAANAWLGDAIAIKDPTAVTFRPQSGSNLLICGQRDESALAMMAMSLVSLAAQHDPGSVEFLIMDGSSADSPNAGYLEKVASYLPHEGRIVGWREVEDALGALSAECDRRQNDDDAGSKATYLFIFGLQRYRMLRQSDDFSFSMDEDKPVGADKLFSTIVREGPALGIHTLLWSDTLTNLERVLDRAGMREFDNRVLFQMSATDSTNLIDSPAASKMGIRRALLYNEEHGQLEKFRAYAVPDERWLEFVRERLGARPAVAR